MACKHACCAVCLPADHVLTARARLTLRQFAKFDSAATALEEVSALVDGKVTPMLENVLSSIKGEKKAEHEERERGYTYRERSYGAFQRAIPLDVDVLVDQVAATFKNGVLTITLPKSPDAQRNLKRIAISGVGEEKHEDPKPA